MGLLANRACMSVSGLPGTGTITLGMAVSGYQSFAAAGMVSGVYSYAINDGSPLGSIFEFGEGTYNASAGTFARTTVLGNSMGTTSAIMLTSAAQVGITPLAGDSPAPIQGLPSALQIVNGGTNGQGTTANTQMVLSGTVAAGALAGTAFSIPISMGTTGAGGLDTGAVAANTWYSVSLITNGGTLSGIFSKNAAPSLPSGYTTAVRCGWVRTDASGNLLRTIQLGRRVQYRVTGEANNAGLPIIASGSQGSFSGNGTMIAASVATLVPATSSKIAGALYVFGNSTGALAPNGNYNPNPGYANTAPIVRSNPTTGDQAGIPFEMILESTSLYYAANSSYNDAVVLGWEDNL